MAVIIGCVVNLLYTYMTKWCINMITNNFPIRGICVSNSNISKPQSPSANDVASWNATSLAVIVPVKCVCFVFF